MAFDSLRFARRLRDAGVPEPQADAHAELMAETLSHFAENLLTKDHFEAVLEARFAAQDAILEQRFVEQSARFEQRFVEQDARFEQCFVEQDARFKQRFVEQDAKFEQRFSKQETGFEQRFSKQDRTLALHTWMLGILVLVMVVPQLQGWLA